MTTSIASFLTWTGHRLQMEGSTATVGIRRTTAEGQGYAPSWRRELQRAWLDEASDPAQLCASDR